MFEKNKKYALVGPGGCGKSTLLKLLIQFISPYSGKITIDETEIKDYTADSLYNEISYIDQHTFIFDSTIKDNITLSRQFTEEELNLAIQQSALTDVIKPSEQGLDTPTGENGCKLSGGQRQRIAIARALINHKSIILMDESTSALDKENAFEVEQKLLENPNLTVVVVSHHIDERLKEKFDCIYKL